MRAGSIAWLLILLAGVGGSVACRSDCDRYAALKNRASELCKACIKNSCSRQAAAADKAMEAAKADKACAEGCEPQERIDCACMGRCLTTPAVKAAMDNTHACIVSSCSTECR